AVGAVGHAAEHVAVGQTGGHEVAVVGGDQVVGVQDAVQLQACVKCLATLEVVHRCEDALDLATHALHGAGGDDALGGATGAQHHVHGVGVLGGCHGTGNVAVGDEA